MRENTVQQTSLGSKDQLASFASWLRRGECADRADQSFHIVLYYSLPTPKASATLLM